VNKQLSLLAIKARLEAEISNKTPVFPDALQDAPDIVQDQIQQYAAGRRLLLDATTGIEQSLDSLKRELKIARTMVADGLLSKVEMMRLERQVAELQNRQQERINQYQQQALEKLGQVRQELSRIDGQLVMRNDALRRTQLRAPVRGFVKKIHVGTIGGIVAPGTPIMEIVPASDSIVIEARIKPGDIGFVSEGQAATIKLTAYEFPIYGGLTGRVDYISPDALGSQSPRDAGSGTYYLARVHVPENNLRGPAGPLPVRPGMTGTVEIETGDRSVLSFLLRPVLKSREAFREQ
jgi:adhesin transport system membrane fusion protein